LRDDPFGRHVNRAVRRLLRRTLALGKHGCILCYGGFGSC
jgi:hypothetical protein